MVFHKSSVLLTTCGWIRNVVPNPHCGVCVGFRSLSRSPRSGSIRSGGGGLPMIRRTFLELAGASIFSPSLFKEGSGQLRLEKYSVSREGVYNLRLYQRESEDRVHVQFLELRAAVSVASWSDAYAVARYLDDVVTDFTPELFEASQYRFRIDGSDAVMRLEEWDISYRGEVWCMDSKDYIRGIFDFPVKVEVDSEEELHRGLGLFQQILKS